MLKTYAYHGKKYFRSYIVIKTRYNNIYNSIVS